MRKHRAADLTSDQQPALIDGTRLTVRDKLERVAAEPMRGGDAAPPAGGLFNDDARAQVDLFDGAR